VGFEFYRAAQISGSTRSPLSLGSTVVCDADSEDPGILKWELRLLPIFEKGDRLLIHTTKRGRYGDEGAKDQSHKARETWLVFRTNTCTRRTRRMLVRVLTYGCTTYRHDGPDLAFSLSYKQSAHRQSEIAAIRSYRSEVHESLCVQIAKMKLLGTMLNKCSPPHKHLFDERHLSIPFNTASPQSYK